MALMLIAPIKSLILTVIYRLICTFCKFQHNVLISLNKSLILRACFLLVIAHFFTYCKTKFIK